MSLYANGICTSDRNLGSLGRGPLALLVRFPRFSPCTLHPEVSPPRALLAIHGAHCLLGLIFATEVDKEVVVVTGFESLSRVRGKQFADALTNIIAGLEGFLIYQIPQLENTYTWKSWKKLLILILRASWSVSLGRPPT